MKDFPVHLFSREPATENPFALPAELWAVDTPPERLYVRGRPEALELLARLPERGLAVVGTRSPQSRSLATTQRAIRLLQGSRLVVISGLALGIDACAHQTALEAGLPTIGVLGCGIERMYPPEHGALAARILENGGLIVSELEPEAEPIAFQFLRRNRLIAAWAKATWVVEAGVRSGALNTARWARDHGRACLATPGYPGDPALLGNQGLIDQHHALPFWGAHSLGSVWFELSSLGMRPRGRKNAGPPRGDHPLPAQVARLLGEISRRTVSEGGAHVESLLDWSLEQGWTPLEFYRTLQMALREPFINDRAGYLVSG
jgi:DNA protecting protein DprA